MIGAGDQLRLCLQMITGAKVVRIAQLYEDFARWSPWRQTAINSIQLFCRFIPCFRHSYSLFLLSK